MRINECLFQDADCDLIDITLSRRNLESLLAKLDGYPANSLLTIEKWESNNIIGPTKLIVRAEENESHYDRPEGAAGTMHHETERAIGDNFHE